MLGRRAAAVAAGAIAISLAACGGAGAGTGGGAAQRQPAATATPAPPPGDDVLVVGDTEQTANRVAVSLVGADGKVLGRATLPAGNEWSVSAGPHGAYWVDGSTLEHLDTRGHISDLGDVEPNQNGHVAVSPDGRSWVYATSSMTPNGVRTNRLWRAGIGVASQMIAERVDDPMHPTPGMPAEWIYALKSWTTAGVLIVREPAGGCGCGPFDMETVSGSSLLVDPYTGAGTPLGTDGSCPLSGGSIDATVVCFHTKPNSGLAADEMRVIRPDRTAQRFTLSGTTAGGDARFDPTGELLAYATVASTAECGSWNTQTTLRVLDLGSGEAHAVGPEGFQPGAWLAGGRIGGLLGGDGGGIASIDPRTGVVHTLMAGSSLYVVGSVSRA